MHAHPIGCPWAPRATLPIYTFLFILCSWQTRSSGQVKLRGQCRVRPSVSLTYDLAGVSWASTGHVWTRDTIAGDQRSAIACVRINVSTNASHLYDLCPTAGRTPLLPDRRCARRRRSRPYRWVQGFSRNRDRHSIFSQKKGTFDDFPLSIRLTKITLVWFCYGNLAEIILFLFIIKTFIVITVRKITDLAFEHTELSTCSIKELTYVF